MYFVHKDGWKRKKQSLKKVSPLFGIFTFLTFTTSHANLVDGMRPGILAPAFFDGAPRTTRPRESPIRQWEKEKVSHCCTTDVCLHQFMNQLYNNQNMAQLVLFPTACTGLGGHLFRRFCNMFSESSTGSWAELQLPYCPSKEGELPENMLQNLLQNLPPQTVVSPKDQLQNYT